MSFRKSLLFHLKPALILGVITQLLLFLTNWIIISFDRDLRLLNFVLGNLIILAAIIYFYRRTIIFPLGWTLLNLLLNIGIGCCELGILSIFIEDTFLFHSKILTPFYLAMIASFFLALNKVVLDEMFQTFGVTEIKSPKA